MTLQKKETNEMKKAGIKGWIALFVLMILLSGVLKDNQGPLAALDFNNLLGKFGVISEGLNFTGEGGLGAREGFLIALTLIPSVMLCGGMIQVAEHLGAMDAAGTFFKPLLKPLLGIPGECGLAFISSFTGSDVAAVLTKDLYDDGYITDDERTVFVAYQYAASAPINNTINAGAPLAAISALAFGPVFVIQIICKIVGANIVRLVIALSNKKNKTKEA